MSKNSLLPLIIAVVALVVSVDAKIPSYIHLCNRNDPDMSSCVENSVNELKPKMIQGIPELEVPPIEPLELGHINLNLGPGIKVEGRNIQLSGLKDFQIRKLSVNIKDDVFYMEIDVPKLLARGTYDIDTKIGSIALKGTGPLSLVGETVTGHITLHGKKIPKNNKTLYYFASMQLKLSIADYDLKLEGIGGGDKTLGEVTNKVLKDEKASILESVLPAIEEALSQYLLKSANNVCKHFTWEELFPVS
ncbi:circadian clock-controlled protein daywake-like [Diprion similis]|uniref:circadian clock-controlled protein daywake-like n=1 Tax=Diprion similis TaxID=362088 RepID=UPI001EF87497|nr:circadian clock-controlled protein daywake-like [Diprion similis]